MANSEVIVIKTINGDSISVTHGHTTTFSSVTSVMLRSYICSSTSVDAGIESAIYFYCETLGRNLTKDDLSKAVREQCSTKSVKIHLKRDTHPEYIKFSRIHYSKAIEQAKQKITKPVQACVYYRNVAIIITISQDLGIDDLKLLIYDVTDVEPKD